MRGVLDAALRLLFMVGVAYPVVLLWLGIHVRHRERLPSKVLVIFPEGTRGQPEQLAELKAGIWHLAKRFPHVPVVPVYMHGLGKAMPKGTRIPVPFYVQVAVGNALSWAEDKAAFMGALRDQLHKLKHKVHIPAEDDE